MIIRYLNISFIAENKHYEEKDDNLIYRKMRRMKLKSRKNREDRLKVLERRGREMFIKDVSNVKRG